ncbi:Carboxylate-amine ligase YbdK [Rhodobacteraceae bacterium THAF1]|uniref:carboxylate-amine ligase n=1 Tax=Palleronia sp. THAF1 TaxID=2587842 RepID=UPI000F403DBD|nr:carboxylate-amine ligase [Palleronia sp. THAF1]QFU09155.1 Carboxylate-amine ligase YbdK [Palleronia sp. THAF1]VDC24037.1 Carboxylate-amine ligase YbdK [Rhodobacteraceae bacterium THAF1]
MNSPPFTIGIEEEYLLVDAETFDLAEAPEAMITACQDRLGDQVAPEFLRCQIEVGTKVCDNIDVARADLSNLRRVIKEVAAEHGLAPIAAACHPTAQWSEQTHRDRERYNQLKADLAGVGERMLICGMHVHVGLPDDDTRIDLMNQLSYFLPHLLALSTSSPYWQGRDTGLASYRIGIFDNLPRTGLPPRLSSWSEYQRLVDTLIGAGLIEDASKIWWDLRPSDAFPTIESRICDVCPRIEHTLSIAATIQAICRYLWRLKRKNGRWRIYENTLLDENRWRARRYGTTEGLIDFGRGEVVPMAELVDELIDLIAEDAEALGGLDAVQGLRAIVTGGTSSDRQRAAFARAKQNGNDEATALRAVTRALVDDFMA